MAALYVQDTERAGTGACPYTTKNTGAQAMQFDFNEEKNQLLLRERGVTFQEVIAVLLSEGALADFPHPNTTRYPHQRILVVEMNDYTYCVPYVRDGTRLFLKTIFPNREFLYLLEAEK